MYCDTEKENNHIAGEELVLSLVAMHYTNIVYPANSVTCLFRETVKLRAAATSPTEICKLSQQGLTKH